MASIKSQSAFLRIALHGVSGNPKSGCGYSSRFCSIDTLLYSTSSGNATERIAIDVSRCVKY